MIETVFHNSITGGEYSVLTSDDTDRLLLALRETISKRRVLLLTDETVEPLYSSKVVSSLTGAYSALVTLTISGGEKSKNINVLKSILEVLLHERFTRDDFIINLGGGVVSDLGGFAASVYMRGMKYVNIPTTLLGMVDSAMGGKTGVDHNGVKNIFGSIYAPALVIEPVEFLSSLDEHEIRSGLGEIVKYDLISGKGILEEYSKTGVIGESAVAACCRIKREYVDGDELDGNKRRVLNLGHTFGHAFEAASGFELSHGQAVALGLIYETRFGETLGLSEPGTAKAVEALAASAGLLGDPSGFANKASELLIYDKKNSGSIITMPVARSVGCIELHSVNLDTAASYLKNLA